MTTITTRSILPPANPHGAEQGTRTKGSRATVIKGRRQLLNAQVLNLCVAN